MARWLRARLTPGQGAIWIKAFEQAESNQRAGGDSSGDSLDDSLEAGDFAARRADVMTDALAETLREPSERKATCSGDRYQVVVHVSAETLSANVSAETFSGSGVGTIEGGPHLHPETVRRLTCDGALVSVLTDGQGKVLNVGRKTRVIPTAIRRALRARETVVSIRVVPRAATSTVTTSSTGHTGVKRSSTISFSSVQGITGSCTSSGIESARRRPGSSSSSQGAGRNDSDQHLASTTAPQSVSEGKRESALKARWRPHTLA